MYTLAIPSRTADVAYPVKAGSNIKLVCLRNPRTVLWYKDSDNLAEISSDCKLTPRGNSSVSNRIFKGECTNTSVSIVLGNIEAGDHGPWFCSLGGSQISQKISFTIEENTKPTFKVTGGSCDDDNITVVNAGSNVTFCCITHSFTLTTARWYRGLNTTLRLTKENDDCRLQTLDSLRKAIKKACDPNRFSIVLTNVQKDDEGNWSCAVKPPNKQSTQSSTISLKVETQTGFQSHSPSHSMVVIMGSIGGAILILVVVTAVVISLRARKNSQSDDQRPVDQDRDGTQRPDEVVVFDDDFGGQYAQIGNTRAAASTSPNQKENSRKETEDNEIIVAENILYESFNKEELDKASGTGACGHGTDVYSVVQKPLKSEVKAEVQRPDDGVRDVCSVVQKPSKN